MNKQYRVRVMPFVLALAVLVIAVPAFAGGSAETAEGEVNAEPGDESGSAGNTDTPIPAADSLAEAIELAMALPGEWDYDPGARRIFSDGLTIDYPIQLDERQWESRLDSFEYYVLREKGTEYAFSNPMHASRESGIYYSRATGQPLFSSGEKYDSGTGWPSFTRPINPHAIVYVLDASPYGTAIEVVDSLSGSHLGHVFSDGPGPTGQRYCINAASLIFVPDGEAPPPLIQELQALASGQ